MKFFFLVWLIYDLYLLLSMCQFNKYERKYVEEVNTFKMKQTFIERIYRKLNYGVNNMRVRSFINPAQFIYLSIVLGSIIGYFFFLLSHALLPTVIVSFTFLMLPYLLLEVMVERNQRLLAKQVTPFVSALTRWSIVNDDIYYCIEKAMLQLEDPIKSYLVHFLNQVKYSGNIAFAFDSLLMCSNNETFKNVIINIRQSNYNRGNLFPLFERLEEECYQIEGELEKRYSKTYWDRVILIIVMIFILCFSIVVLMTNDGLRFFYLATTIGKLLLSLYVVLYFIGFLLMTRVNTFNY